MLPSGTAAKARSLLPDDLVRPGLVLLPGLDGTGRAFQALQSHLAPLDAGVIALAGRSTGYVSDLQAARQQLPKSGPYILVAESYSGPIGISIAATRPPGLVGLVLSTTFLRCPRPYLGQLRPLLKVLPPIRVPTTPFVPLLLNGRSTPEARKLLHLVLNLASPSAMLARLNGVATVDVTAEAQAIDVPTLYLRAGADRVVPRSASDTVKRYMPGAIITELAGPHLLLQACPREAAEEIRKFSTGLRP